MRSKIVIGMIFALIFIGCGKFDSPVSVASVSSIKGVVRDDAGNLIKGAVITTTPTTQSVTTSATGEYEIANLEAGQYLISGTMDTYYPNEINVALDAGQTIQANITLEQIKYANLEGYITDDAGNPLAGATITTLPATQSVITDSKGMYMIQNIDIGKYTVTGIKDGYITNQCSVIAKPTETAVGSFAIQKITITTIKGIITDEKGNALSGASITTIPATQSLTSEADGSYLLLGITAGQYTVAGTKSGFSKAQSVITIVNGQVVQANLQLATVKPELQASSPQLLYGTSSSTMQLTLSNKYQTGSIAYTLSVPGDASWLTLSSPGGTLAGADLAAIVCTVNRTGLQPGNYSTAITVTSNAGAATIQVLMTVPDPTSPLLTVNTTMLDFGADLTTISYTLTNTGKGSLAYSLNCNKSWLSLNQNSGNLTAGTSTTITVTADRSTLTANSTNNANITVSSNGGTTIVPVVCKVSDKGAIAATTLFVKAKDSDTARIEWFETDNVAKFKNYKLFYSTKPGVTENSTLIGTYDSISTSGANITYSALNKNEFLYFKLYIYDKNGVGTPSNELIDTCPIPMGTYTLVSSTIQNITDVYSVNDNCAWMVTSDGYFYKWDGSTWKKSAVADTSLLAIRMVSTTEGYAKSAKSLYKYDGTSWKIIAALPAIASAHGGEMSVVNGSMIFLDAGTNDSLYRFDGTGFTNQGIALVASLAFYNDTKGYAVTNGNLMEFNGFGWTVKKQSGKITAIGFGGNGDLYYSNYSNFQSGYGIFNATTGAKVTTSNYKGTSLFPFSDNHIIYSSNSGEYYDYYYNYNYYYEYYRSFIKHISNSFSKTPVFTSTTPTKLYIHSPASGWGWNSSNIYMYR